MLFFLVPDTLGGGGGVLGQIVKVASIIVGHPPSLPPLLPAVLIASLGAGKKACWRITDLPEVIFKDLPAGNFGECFVPNVRLQPGTIWKSSNGLSLSGQGPLCITNLSGEDAVSKGTVCR